MSQFEEDTGRVQRELTEAELQIQAVTAERGLITRSPYSRRKNPRICNHEFFWGVAPRVLILHILESLSSEILNLLLLR